MSHSGDVTVQLFQSNTLRLSFWKLNKAMALVLSDFQPHSKFIFVYFVSFLFQPLQVTFSGRLHFLLNERFLLNI